MLITILALLVMVAGILVYALSANAKVAEIGRTMMWTGMLVTLLVASHYTVKLP